MYDVRFNIWSYCHHPEFSTTSFFPEGKSSRNFLCIHSVITSLVMKMARLIKEKGFLLPQMFFSRKSHEYLMKHTSTSYCDTRAEPPAGVALLKSSFDEVGCCAQGKLASVQKLLERHKYFREFHLRSAFCALICQIDNFSRQSILPFSHIRMPHHQCLFFGVLSSVHVEGSHSCPRNLMISCHLTHICRQAHNLRIMLFECSIPPSLLVPSASCVQGFVLPCKAFMLLAPTSPSSRGGHILGLRFKLRNTRKGAFIGHNL